MNFYVKSSLNSFWNFSKLLKFLSSYFTLTKWLRTWCKSWQFKRYFLTLFSSVMINKYRQWGVRRFNTFCNFDLLTSKAFPKICNQVWILIVKYEWRIKTYRVWIFIIHFLREIHVVEAVEARDKANEAFDENHISKLLKFLLLFCVFSLTFSKSSFISLLTSKHWRWCRNFVVDIDTIIQIESEPIFNGQNKISSNFFLENTKGKLSLLICKISSQKLSNTWLTVQDFH